MGKRHAIGEQLPRLHCLVIADVGSVEPGGGMPGAIRLGVKAPATIVRAVGVAVEIDQHVRGIRRAQRHHRTGHQYSHHAQHERSDDDSSDAVRERSQSGRPRGRLPAARPRKCRCEPNHGDGGPNSKMLLLRQQAQLVEDSGDRRQRKVPDGLIEEEAAVERRGSEVHERRTLERGACQNHAGERYGGGGSGSGSGACAATPHSCLRSGERKGGR